MPTYVYACSACDTTFEADQRITEASLDSCVACGSHGTVKRVIQPVGISFKGSGFHINDYSPSKSSEKPADSEPAAAEPAASSGEPASPPASAPAATAIESPA